MLKKRTVWQKLILTTRVGLLLLTLAALITSAVWSLAPAQVERLDSAITQRVVRVAKRELESIRTLAKSDQEQARAQYLEFIEAHSGVRKGDRKSDYVIQAMTELSKIYARQGDVDAAVSWAKTRSDYDKNDLVAQAELISLLLGSPEHDVEGVELLKSLYQRVPEFEDVSRLYASYLVRIGERAKVAAVAELFFQRSVQSFEKGWRVFWDLGKGFTAGQSKPVQLERTSNEHALVGLEFPPAVKRVRLDPPPHSRLSLTQARFRLGTGSSYVSLADVKVESHDMSVSPTELLTGGGDDPYFYWDIPLGEGEEGVAFEFVASIESAYPAWGTTLIQNTSAADVRGHELKLYWAENKDAFSENRSQARAIEYMDMEGGAKFSLTFAAGPQVKRLRLDFPDVENVSYKITDLLLRGEGRDVRVDLLTEKSVLEHQVDRDANRFRVLGPDPHFAVAFKEQLAFHSVEVRGVVE